MSSVYAGNASATSESANGNKKKAAKGSGGAKAGKFVKPSKGCWNCGSEGHFRSDCPDWKGKTANNTNNNSSVDIRALTREATSKIVAS